MIFSYAELGAVQTPPKCHSRGHEVHAPAAISPSPPAWDPSVCIHTPWMKASCSMLCVVALHSGWKVGQLERVGVLHCHLWWRNPGEDSRVYWSLLRWKSMQESRNCHGDLSMHSRAMSQYEAWLFSACFFYVHSKCSLSWYKVYTQASTIE